MPADEPIESALLTMAMNHVRRAPVVDHGSLVGMLADTDLAQSLPDDALREAARRTDEEIGRQVEASEEIAELVQALERQYDAFVDAAGREGLLADEAGNMPTAEELGAQFERFLAEQQGRTDSPDA